MEGLLFWIFLSFVEHSSKKAILKTVTKGSEQSDSKFRPPPHRTFYNL